MKKIIQILALMFLSGIAQADIYSDAEDYMNVKESVFQNYFPSHQQTINAQPWLYRYYPETNNYQGINLEDGLHYVMGSDFSPDTPLILEDDGWVLEILDTNGTELPLHKDSGLTKLVAGQTYTLKGIVANQHWQNLSGGYVVLETRRADETDPNAWYAHKTIPLNDSRKFETTFTLPPSIKHDHHFRLREFPDDGEASTTVSDSLITSETLTTTVSYEVVIQLINNTKHDLIFNVPVGGTISGQVDTYDYPISNTVSGQLDTVPIQVNVDQTMTLTYIDPRLGSSFGFVVNRTDCFASCDNFVVNWAHKPNKNYTACVDQMPKLNSGQNHYVRVTPRTLSASMDLFIWGDNDPLCSAGLDNGWGNFWDDHPGLTRFAEVTAGVAAVALVVVTFPEELVVEDAVLLGPANPAGIEDFMTAQLVMQGEDQESIDFAIEMFRDWVKPFF